MKHGQIVPSLSQLMNTALSEWCEDSGLTINITIIVPFRIKRKLLDLFQKLGGLLYLSATVLDLEGLAQKEGLNCPLDHIKVIWENFGSETIYDLPALP